MVEKKAGKVDKNLSEVLTTLGLGEFTLSCMRESAGLFESSRALRHSKGKVEDIEFKEYPEVRAKYLRAEAGGRSVIIIKLKDKAENPFKISHILIDVTPVGVAVKFIQNENKNTGQVNAIALINIFLKPNVWRITGFNARVDESLMNWDITYYGYPIKSNPLLRNFRGEFPNNSPDPIPVIEDSIVAMLSQR